jgi:hypothetical protein
MGEMMPAVKSRCWRQNLMVVAQRTQMLPQDEEQLQCTCAHPERVEAEERERERRRCDKEGTEPRRGLPAALEGLSALSAQGQGSSCGDVLSASLSHCCCWPQIRDGAGKFLNRLRRLRMRQK